MKIEELYSLMSDHSNFVVSVGRKDFNSDEDPYYLSDDDQYEEVVVVRICVDDVGVSVVKDSLKEEEAIQEAYDRLECKRSGKDYPGDNKKDTEQAVEVLRLALKELGFDRAVSLMEKLNAIGSKSNNCSCKCCK